MRRALPLLLAAIGFLAAQAAADEPPRVLAVPSGNDLVSIEVGPPQSYSRNGRRATGVGFAHFDDGTSVPLHVLRTTNARRARDVYRVRQAKRSGRRVRARFHVDHDRPERAENVRIRSRGVLRFAGLAFEDPTLPPERAEWEPAIVAFGIPRDDDSTSGTYVTDVAIAPDGNLVLAGGTTTNTDLESWTDGARWRVTPDGDVTRTHLGPIAPTTGVTRPLVVATDGGFSAGWANLPLPEEPGRAVPHGTGASVVRTGIIWSPDGEPLALTAPEPTCESGRRIHTVLGVTRAGRIEDVRALVEVVECGTWTQSWRVWNPGGYLEPLTGTTSLGPAGLSAIGISEDGKRIGGKAYVSGPGNFFAYVPVWWDEDRELHELVLDTGWALWLHDFSPNGRYLVGFAADDATGQHLLWDLESPDSPPTVLTSQPWDRSSKGLNGGRLEVGRDGTVLDVRGARIREAGNDTWEDFRTWLARQGLDVDPWHALLPRALESDEQGIAFAGRAESHGTARPFAAFVPR